MPISLGELATQVGCELIGDPDALVYDVASLHNATPKSLTFLSNPALTKQLSGSRAAAVVLRPADAELCPVAAFVSDNPYATYAQMAALLSPQADVVPGIHASAVIASSASVDSSAQIGPNVVIGENSFVGARSDVGPGTVIGNDCRVGDDCRLLANVTLARSVTIGNRSIVHPGAVIGADGFGNAMTADGWIKVPQLGGVSIGADVEIGANTTIDCGAIGDTKIADGVRIDNLCMIGHNVEIGEHTAMAAMAGIAGSTIVGKRCLIAGQSGAVGHISICDDVIVSAKTMISKNIVKPGTYAAGFPASTAKSWARQLARFRRLDNLIERVRKLEK